MTSTWRVSPPFELGYLPFSGTRRAWAPDKKRRRGGSGRITLVSPHYNMRNGYVNSVIDTTKVAEWIHLSHSPCNTPTPTHTHKINLWRVSSGGSDGRAPHRQLRMEGGGHNRSLHYIYLFGAESIRSLSILIYLHKTRHRRDHTHIWRLLILGRRGNKTPKTHEKLLNDGWHQQKMFTVDCCHFFVTRLVQNVYSCGVVVFTILSINTCQSQSAVFFSLFWGV